MFIEKVVLDNFRCFGSGRSTVRLEDGLTTFIGANGSGKTAVCEALRRLFGITGQERTIRRDDFHVPADEVSVPLVRRVVSGLAVSCGRLRYACSTAGLTGRGS